MHKFLYICRKSDILIATWRRGYRGGLITHRSQVRVLLSLTFCFITLQKGSGDVTPQLEPTTCPLAQAGGTVH